MPTRWITLRDLQVLDWYSRRGEGLSSLRATCPCSSSGGGDGNATPLRDRGGVQLAIAIEFINVVVRKSAIEAKFPGGLDGFAHQDLPNFLEDDHLVKVGFMNPQDTSRFLEELEAAGLCYSDGDNSDIAVVERAGESIWPWLVLGAHEGRTACWLNGQSPRELVDFEPSMLLRCPPHGLSIDRRRGPPVRRRGYTDCEPKQRILRRHPELHPRRCRD